MKLAVMQPYFFPYIGYFQLMNAVDEFVVYDNIEYTKKGWINRNRILVNGQPAYVTIPLKNDSDILDVKDRHLASSWPIARQDMLNRITGAYRKSPYFDIVRPMVEKCLLFEENNLFSYILHTLKLTCEYLGIQTRLTVSSAIPIDHSLKAQRKVIEICRARNSDEYWNPIGGTALYAKEEFQDQGIALHFLKANDISYRQFENAFVPNLSILDVMMFNSKEEITGFLGPALGAA